MTILLSFLPCLSLIWMYFFLFLPNPLSFVLCLSLLVFLFQCVSLCVCLSFYVFSLLLPSLPPPLLLSFFLSLSDSRCPHLRWNSTGAPPGKVLPLSSSALSPALHHRIKLASLSFFLCSSDRSYSFSPFHNLSILHMPKKTIQTP